MNRRYLEHLAAVPFFRDCETADLKAIARCGTDMRVGVGRQLTREGRAGYEFFVIVSGTADVERGGHVVATLGPGDHFGELALLGDGRRNATVTATSDMEVIVVQSTQFRVLMERAPRLASTLMARLGTRVAAQDELLTPSPTTT